MLSSYENDVEMADVEDEEEDEEEVKDALGLGEGSTKRAFLAGTFADSLFNRRRIRIRGRSRGAQRAGGG